MLVLTRKTGERIQVGANIVIRVIRTGKGSVRLGIEAPRGISVVRSEIADPPIVEHGCPGNVDAGPPLTKHVQKTCD